MLEGSEHSKTNDVRTKRINSTMWQWVDFLLLMRPLESVKLLNKNIPNHEKLHKYRIWLPTPVRCLVQVLGHQTRHIIIVFAKMVKVVRAGRGKIFNLTDYPWKTVVYLYRHFLTFFGITIAIISSLNKSTSGSNDGWMRDLIWSMMYQNTWLWISNLIFILILLFMYLAL
jgi:hypothetical protein